jgi:hypothetical protein
MQQPEGQIMLSSRIAVPALLVATLMGAACGTTGTPSPFEPSGAPAEQLSQSFSAGIGTFAQSLGDWGNSHPTSCTPLPAVTASRDIGPAGGLLPIGPHLLVVPPGALSARIRISGQITTDSVNSVQFAPAGLVFLTPAKLLLSYRNCTLVPLTNMKIVYTSDDLLQLLETVESRDLKLIGTVEGTIRHFSRYAVAY